MQNLLQELIEILSENDALVSDGKLMKNKIVELALNLDSLVIKPLLKSDSLKKHFFSEVDGLIIFDKIKFQKFVSNKEFLPDSYTSFKNKIGLSVNDEFIKDSEDVVLSWPYKDCILEGGQDKEDSGREEIFWNEVLAPDQIDRLLSAKVLTNFKKINKDGIQQCDDVCGEDNLIIKGNNLLVLENLLKVKASQIKLIYIDPPYNTGSDSFQYNDSFNRSSWLTFISNRLKVAKKLLKHDGAIFVQVDDNEQGYLRVLMDEIFGEENFINTISVKTKVAGVSGSHHGKSLANTVEYIHLYAKDRNSFFFEKTLQSKVELEQYIQDYEDSGKSWKYTSVITDIDEGEYVSSIKDGSGDEIKIFKHTTFKTASIQSLAKKEFEGNKFSAYKKYINAVFRTTNAQSSIRARIMDATRDWENEVVSIEYVPRSGKDKGNSIKLFYKDRDRNLIMWLKDTVQIDEDGSIYKTDNLANLWTDIQYNNLTREGDVQFPNGKKPEKILFNIISLITKPGDTVLDFHLGSGTTAAVAHKMGRKYIGVEQLDYIDDTTISRMQNVISGEQGGISKDVNWQGGGEFIYCELAKANQTYIDKITNADTTDDLLIIWGEMQDKAFLSYKVNPKAFNASINDFKELSRDDQRKFLFEVLDKNMLYVPLSEIDDEAFGISETDKALNKKFFGSR